MFVKNYIATIVIPFLFIHMPISYPYDASTYTLRFNNYCEADSIAFHPQKNLFVFATPSAEVGLCLFDSKKNDWILKQTLVRPRWFLVPLMSFSSVAFDQTGMWLASASWDEKTVNIWCFDFKNDIWVYKQALIEHTDCVRGVAFDPTSTWLATASYDKTIKLWNLDKKNNIWGYKQTLSINYEGRSVAFDKTGTWLAASLQHKGIMLWRLNPNTLKWFFEQYLPIGKQPYQLIVSIAFDPTGTWFAATTSEGIVNLYSLNSKNNTFVCKQTLVEKDETVVRSVTFDPTGKWLAYTSNNHTIKLWHWSSQKLEWVYFQTLIGHTDAIWSIAFNSTGIWLVSASSDCTIKLWEIPQNSLEECIPTNNEPKYELKKRKPVNIENQPGGPYWY